MFTMDFIHAAAYDGLKKLIPNFTWNGKWEGNESVKVGIDLSAVTFAALIAVSYKISPDPESVTQGIRVYGIWKDGIVRFNETGDTYTVNTSAAIGFLYTSARNAGIAFDDIYTHGIDFIEAIEKYNTISYEPVLAMYRFDPDSKDIVMF